MQPDGGYFVTLLHINRIGDGWCLLRDGLAERAFAQRVNAERAGRDLAVALARDGRDVCLRVFDGDDTPVSTFWMFALEDDDQALKDPAEPASEERTDHNLREALGLCCPPQAP